MPPSRSQLNSIVANVLGVAPALIHDQSDARDFEKWDSLRIITIASMIEIICGITLSSEELTQMISMPAIYAIVERHTGPIA